MPDAISMHHLSDEQGDYGSFTGTFAGMACQDISGQQLKARFTRFAYQSL